MASTSPPILPVTSSVESQPPLRAFINQISETVTTALSTRRPWSELADLSTLSKPDSISSAAARIRKNYAYFKVNYLAVATAIVGFSLVTHPFLLRLPPLSPRVLALPCLASLWCFLLMLDLFLSRLWWWVSRWYVLTEDLFLDEQETAATGFLSFLGNSAASKRLRSTARGYIILFLFSSFETSLHVITLVQYMK